MKTYALNALMKVRTITEEEALFQLKNASHKVLSEEQVAHKIADDILKNRKTRQGNIRAFFDNSQAGCSQTRAVAMASWQAKMLMHENQMKANLTKQQKNIEQAKLIEDLATKRWQDQARDLRIIEKHYSQWQQTKKRGEEAILDKALDDFNCANFRPPRR
jgi:hypothetical protein